MPRWLKLNWSGCAAATETSAWPTMPVLGGVVAGGGGEIGWKAKSEHGGSYDGVHGSALHGDDSGSADGVWMEA